MIEQSTLASRVNSNFAIPCKFDGQLLILDGAGVLYWPAKECLVFSDLHFEKGSFLTQFAHPLPRFDTTDTLKRMQALLETYSPKQVICLGDSFHDGNAYGRMQSDDIEYLNELIKKYSNWQWILGNHDPEIPSALQGQRHPVLLIENLLFAHEPEELSAYEDASSQIIGHFHPKNSANINRHKITGKSFCVGDDLMIMPAFGRYTGGLSTSDDAFSKIFLGKTTNNYLCYHNKVYMV